MVGRLVASIVLVLTLSAGVAYAATQMTTSDGTQVCVNEASGLMRVSSTCRDIEYPLTIGGAGDVRVTQNGTFTVQAGQTDGKTLPLTGINVFGTCDLVYPTPSDGFLLPLVQLQAATGEKLDAFGTSRYPHGDVIQGESFATQPLGAVSSTAPEREHSSAWTTIIATSNDATATITIGGSGDWSDQVCTYLWQAVEAPN